MAEVRSSEKTIRLTGLISENYRLWASQSEATFRVYGVLDIVLGREPNPERAASSTPSEDTPDEEVRVAPASLTPAQRKLIEKWQLRPVNGKSNIRVPKPGFDSTSFQRS